LQAQLMLGFALVGDTAAPDDLDPVHEGRALTAELGDIRLHGRFLTLAAVGTFYNDNGFDIAWGLCDEALACADATGDEYGRDLALPLQGLILQLRDRHDEACALLAPVTERLVDRGERGIASTLLVYRSTSALCTGDLARAHRLAERAAEIAEPLGDYHRVGTTRSHLALLLGVGGDIEGGLDLLGGFLRVVEGAGTDVIVPGMARTLGLLHLWRGDVDESVRWLSSIGRADGARPGRPPDPLAMPALAEALRHQGRSADAAAVLGPASTTARRMGMARVLADVLDQQAHLTDPDEPVTAADLHHQALELRVEHGLRTDQVASIDALAALMARTGRPTDAVRTLAAAATTRDAIGLPRRPLDHPGHEATLEDLRALLGDEAYDRTWHEGSQLTLDDAVTFVRRTRGQRGRPSTGWASLTPTEMEVVDLVTQGLSNPDIAAKLFMSRSSVKVHLSHIFSKLGVANRTELATAATTRTANRSQLVGAPADAARRTGDPAPVPVDQPADVPAPGR
jgi:DNA-binding CsgD family transcriptional regulator